MSSSSNGIYPPIPTPNFFLPGVPVQSPFATPVGTNFSPPEIRASRYQALDHMRNLSRKFHLELLKNLNATPVPLDRRSLENRVTHLETIIQCLQTNILFTKEMKTLVEQPLLQTEPYSTQIESQQNTLDSEIKNDEEFIKKLEGFKKDLTKYLPSNSGSSPSVTLNRGVQVDASLNLDDSSEEHSPSASQFARIPSKTPTPNARLSGALLKAPFFTKIFPPGSVLKYSYGPNKGALIDMRVHSYTTSGGKVQVNLEKGNIKISLPPTQQCLFYKPEENDHVLFKVKKNKGYLKGVIREVSIHNNSVRARIQTDPIHRYTQNKGEVYKNYNSLSTLIPMPNKETLDQVFELLPCPKVVLYKTSYIVQQNFRS